jgi:hypothetical protein
METLENGRGSKVIALDSYAATEITQEDLLEERMLTHAAEHAIQLRDAKRVRLRDALSHGALVESGPLKAKLQKRSNRRRGIRRQYGDSYFVLVVYV